MKTNIVDRSDSVGAYKGIILFEAATGVPETRAARQELEAKLSPDQQAGGRRKAEARKRTIGTAPGAGGTKP